MSLIKQHLYNQSFNVNYYRITDIEFDFEDSEGMLPYDEQVAIVDDVLGITWEASDSEDLVEEITACTGFCVKNVDYCHVLTPYFP
jgi:hypothetical protein